MYPRVLRRGDGISAIYGRDGYYTQGRLKAIVEFRERYRRISAVSHSDGLMKLIKSPSPKAPGLSCRLTSESPEEVPSPWNVANAITVGRIAVTPLIGNWIITGRYELALAGLVYAAISDGLDGMLARRLKLQTVVGSYLDPVADKFLISTTSICLAAKGIIPTGLAALMIGRDMGLVGGWLWHTHAGSTVEGRARVFQITQLEPLFISKINTSLQIGLGFTGVLYATEWGIVDVRLLDSLSIATAFTTTASGASYMGKFWQRLPR